MRSTVVISAVVISAVVMTTPDVRVAQMNQAPR
jgi:hypothetical protein